MTPRYSDAPDAPWALLARHLAAEATAAERQMLRDWVQADPSHLQILTTVTRAWERAGEAAQSPIVFSPADVETAWQRFRPLLAPAPTIAPKTKNHKPKTENQPTVSKFRWPLQRRAQRRWQLMAALLLLFGAGYGLRGLLRPTETTVAYATAGQRQRQQLPDGSTVWLNAHSRLHYTWAGPRARNGPRRVQLTGEAYFEVAPNPARPFLVSTATARVRVTGTAFNVRAYAAEDSVEVAVTHGRVWLRQLAAPADSVLLTANTRAALHATDAPGHVARPLRADAADAANARAWQTDTLRFADASVAQVARTLRAAFGTTVVVASPALGQCRFTGTFARPRPAQVLAVLAATTASHLSDDGHGGYVLSGAGCAPAAAPATAPPDQP